LKRKAAGLVDSASGITALSDSFKGMAEADFSKLITGLTESLAVIGMSAQQAEEYRAKLRGATDEQAALAGVLAGMAETANKLQKATADKDAKAQEGAKALLSALVAQEVQLVANIASAAEYARLIALGVSPIRAALDADELGEKKGAEAQEKALARVK